MMMTLQDYLLLAFLNANHDLISPWLFTAAERHNRDQARRRIQHGAMLLKRAQGTG